MTRPVQLVWLRNDLRLQDNSALWNAAQRGPVVACCILTPAQWQQHDMAAVRVDFYLRTLKALSGSLAELGIALRVVTVEDFAAVPQALLELCDEHGVASVHCNREYPVNERARDRAVAEALQARGIEFHAYHDALIAPPGSVRKQDGEPYQVFTPFKRAWLQLVAGRLPDLLPAPEPAESAASDSDPVPDALPEFDTTVPAELWPAGEREALRLLEDFVAERLDDYKARRDCPAESGTSRLSPHLAVGAISARQCLHGALAANGGEFDSGSEGAVTWISELVWREFYHHLLVAFPRLCRYQPFRLETRQLRWRDSESDFRRWCDGATGVPIVDAGMRQLRETGWMHNRVRMIVAMFLTKNLLIDWRRGERHFMRHLVDGDLAANNGGWQWSASTGTDAAPYFRIFNPFTQAERFDPEAEYIQRFVPELASLPARVIHNPTQLARQRPADYPDVMVDLKTSRERAIAAFKAL